MQQLRWEKVMRVAAAGMESPPSQSSRVNMTMSLALLYHLCFPNQNILSLTGAVVVGLTSPPPPPRDCLPFCHSNI